MVTRGFFGRRHPEPPRPIPPGQYLENGFPVLSAGPTPRVPLDSWSFSLEYKGEKLASWTWDQVKALPQTELTVDIHCVTKWSKLDTKWKGVTIDDFLSAAGIEPPTAYTMAFCDGGYTTNVPLADLTGGKSMVAFEYDDQPLHPDHGGPARLFVPHLYLWKSAKWLRGLRFIEQDEPGFWERYGYHMYGDPWKEQRYWND
jgi:DMSO/TMAO reductase YedYZ molybdopterin-dependent catalytic subunit